MDRIIISMIQIAVAGTPVMKKARPPISHYVPLEIKALKGKKKPV